MKPIRHFILWLLLAALLLPPVGLQASETEQENVSSILTRTEDSYTVAESIDGFTYNQLNPNSLYTLVRQVSNYGSTDFLRVQAEQKVQVAALTQLMTYYASENYFSSMRVNRQTTVEIMMEDLAKAERNQANLAGFRPGDQVTVEDLYYAMFLTSGAEAIYALVREAALTESSFVQMMNVLAENLGMKNTLFTNPIGFGDEESYTTLDDLAILLSELVKDPNFRRYAGARTHTTQALASNENGITFTHNMENYASARQLDTARIDGGKTGWTGNSEYCFASFHMEGDTAYLILTAKAKESGLEIQDHLTLYQKMAEIPIRYPLLVQGSTVRAIPLSENEKVRKDLVPQAVLASEDYFSVEPILTDLDRFSLQVETPEALALPLEPGAVVGTADIIELVDGGSNRLKAVELHLPEIVAQETVVATTEVTTAAPTESAVPSTTIEVQEESEPRNFPWPILLVLAVLIFLVGFGVYTYKRRQAAKRRAKLKRLRALQASYGYRSEDTLDPEEMLRRSRQKMSEHNRK